MGEGWVVVREERTYGPVVPSIALAARCYAKTVPCYAVHIYMQCTAVLISSTAVKMMAQIMRWALGETRTGCER